MQTILFELSARYTRRVLYVTPQGACVLTLIVNVSVRRDGCGGGQQEQVWGCADCGSKEFIVVEGSRNCVKCVAQGGGDG